MNNSHPAWYNTTEIERNIQALEDWAASCNDSSSIELKAIIIEKSNTLANRLKRFKETLDSCPNCGNPRQEVANYGSMCKPCNGLDGSKRD